MKKSTWKRSFFSQSAVNFESFEVQKTCDSNEHLARESVSAQGESASSRSYHGKETKSKNVDWMDIFCPTSSDDLALHPKKLLEIKQWFLDYISTSSLKKSKICLITGPTGVGKTAAARVLAKAHEFEIMEWINPLDQNVIGNLGDQVFGETYVVSGLATFKSFLHQASRFRSLGGLKRRLLLVEDFPNALLKDSTSFEEILTDYLGFASSPLMFIVSDSKSRGLNISFNLFPEELKQKLQITHISFNPIANTIMQKAMKRFSTLLRQHKAMEIEYKLPSQAVIDSIILSAQGDIRNALINFHFAALKGAPEVSITEATKHPSNAKKSKSSKKQTSLKSLGCDESCTMLHALGRVFNPKFTTERTLVHSPEVLAADFSTEPKKFLDFMHANYLAHFSDIDDIAAAADCLSSADVVLNEYRDNALSTIALNVAIRGFMIANRKPVKGWLPVRGPKRFSCGESLKPSKLLEPYISRNLQALDFQTFVRLIELNSKK